MNWRFTSHVYECGTGRKRILREEPHFPFKSLLLGFYDFRVLMGKIGILPLPYKDLAQMLEGGKLGIICLFQICFIYFNKFLNIWPGTSLLIHRKLNSQ